jgi:thiol-disulfide isomerase/thioredoxin
MSLNGSIYAQNSQVKIIKIPELEEIIKTEPGKLKVINFWATWCKPCIKELPHFVAAQKKYPDVEFIFMSLDYAENEAKVNAFSKKKGLDKSKMYLIDELDYNSWIDKVSSEWSGAIPGTLFIKGSDKQFFEGEFQKGDLEELIKKKNKL